MWIGGGTGGANKLMKLDPDSMQIVDTITAAEIPEMGMPWGLAVDAQNYLWAVEMGTKAFKIDTTTKQY